MKTRLQKLTAKASALFVAILMFSLLSTTAVASGGHYEHSSSKAWPKKSLANKDWFKKGESKEKRYGKKCPKKECDNSLTIPLYVKGDERVGKITVRLQGGDLKVSYQMKDGWYIKQTNLNVSESYNGLLFNADGSPNIESYPYKSKHFTPVKSADYTISAAQWAIDSNLYVAAQATVINNSYGKCKQYSAKSSHSKSRNNSTKDHQYKSRSKGGYSDHDHDHHEDEHSHKHDNQKYYGKSKELESWALGEKFPGQALSGYFIYKLESCDDAQQSTIQFSDAIYTVNEEGPTALITVTRSGNLGLAASVDYTTNDIIDGAVSGTDYEFATGTLDFAPGQTSAEFMVTPIDDSEVEPVEHLLLQLSNPMGAQLGQQNTATLEIVDNDEFSEAVIAIDRIEPNPANEGATVIIYVTRTGNISGVATVEYGTIDGSAIGSTQCGPAGSPVPFDYEHVGGSLTFDIDEVEIAIEVTTCNNNPRGDGDETFDIEIYNPMGAVLADDGDNDPNSNLSTITIVEGS